MFTTILIIGGVITFILLVAGIVISVSSERDVVEDRIEKFLEAAETDIEYASSEEAMGVDQPSVITDWLNNRVNRTDFGANISTMLARADMKFKPGEYVGLMIISSFVTMVVAYFFGGRGDSGLLPNIFGLVGLIVGAFLPRMYASRQQAKRLNDFNNQLSDMLNLMVNGLRAGYSTMQALEAVSKELPAPISTEFRRVVQEMQLGISMGETLDNLLDRIPSEDLDLVITAINVQREVGGNLAEVLETISHTIRERVRLKGEIKTLTSQVVYSGRFLSLLPIILSGVLYLVNREYFLQFFLEPKWCGISILVCSGFMILAGYLVMNKIADIEV